MSTRKVDREIRLAVVMYGGTSLAIYMNGISQELLQLVRATSPAADPAAARSSTARVYRKLAHVLGGTPLEHVDDDVLAADPPVRFIVDILSGTSAGGINAVMLAKALARNADLEPLKRLWIDEGALEKLINDRRSASPRYPYREPVKALFNSDRMYVELLNALGKLNRPDAPDATALVDDLELAVTGTDLTGELVQLRLADGMVEEYDHKHVFEFRLVAGGRVVDELTAEHDPLLAFAARTTSSLPAVFEPAVVRNARRLVGRRHRDDRAWSLLFRSLRQQDRQRHERHAFADGGYLDNKPFGHAIDRLSQATSGVRVTRKLYYLEPQPQQIHGDAPRDDVPDVPNALENTLHVFSLARYETIRSDIQRIVDRNRLLDRVRTLGFGVLEDLPYTQDGEPRSPEPTDGELRDLIARYGHAYGGYHRLRVARATDALANTVADRLRVAAGDDVRRALRLVARAWRNAHFRRNHDDPNHGLELESAFLRRFDLAFHARRAAFLLNKINHMFKLDDDVVSELEHAAVSKPRISELIEARRRADHGAVDAAWARLQPLLRVGKKMAQRAVYELRLRDASDPASLELNRALRALFQEGGEQSLPALREELLAVLAEPSEAERNLAAERFFERRRPLIAKLARAIEDHHAARVDVAYGALTDLSEIDVTVGLSSEIRDLLLLYWRSFVHFDMVQYPLLEATDLGEELSPVEIHRISAVDARHYGDAFSSGKLQGARFASFGAFLDKRWREHDIRWGRLDGAERLISTMLDGERPEARDQLITEAHLAILRDEFPADEKAVEALVSHQTTPDGGVRMDVATTKRNVAAFLEAQAQDLDLDPRQAADNLSRLVRVGGRLSDTLSTESRMPRPLRNLVGFSSFAGANLIDAAIPKTLGHLVASYWSNLLLLFGVLLLAIDNPVRPLVPLQGGFALGALLVIVALVVLLGRSLLWGALASSRRGRRTPDVRRSRLLGGIATGLTAALVLATAYVGSSGDLRQEDRDLGGYPSATVALGLARSSGQVACILGQQIAARCAAPTSPEAAPEATGRLRLLTFLDFGLLLLYVLLLTAFGLVAVGTSSLRLGLALMALAAGVAVAGGWENARTLATLEMGYADMDEAWLAATATLARAQYLLAFAAIAMVLPVVARRSEELLWSGRVVISTMVVTGALSATLGVAGLALDIPGALAAGLWLLLLSMLAWGSLFAVGYFGAGSGRASPEDQAVT